MSDETIVRNCSPTLAGIKTGSLFSCDYETPEKLREEIRCLNRRLGNKGLQIIPLKIRDGRALIYVYRPSKLRQDFASGEVAEILRENGYETNTTAKCISQLIKKLGSCSDFPHEIGVFLGYPPEDVRGFIENSALNFKFTGCWKVYGDEESARRTFDRYKRCTGRMLSRLEQGNSIEKLTAKQQFA